MVVIGEVIADGIAEGIAGIVGGAVGAMGDAIGPIDSIGEAVGTGCAEAASVAPPAMKLPARTMPTNHRFTEILLALACDES